MKSKVAGNVVNCLQLYPITIALKYCTQNQILFSNNIFSIFFCFTFFDPFSTISYGNTTFHWNAGLELFPVTHQLRIFTVSTYRKKWLRFQNHKRRKLLRWDLGGDYPLAQHTNTSQCWNRISTSDSCCQMWLSFTIWPCHIQFSHI